MPAPRVLTRFNDAQAVFGKCQHAMSPLFDRLDPPQHRLPNGESLKISPPRHHELVTPCECWDRHQLFAPDLKQALNDSYFENFTHANDQRAISHLSSSNKIKTNRFDRLENDKRNYEQRQRGIWTERANPASDTSENPQPRRAKLRTA